MWLVARSHGHSTQIQAGKQKMQQSDDKNMGGGEGWEEGGGQGWARASRWVMIDGMLV